MPETLLSANYSRPVVTKLVVRHPDAVICNHNILVAVQDSYIDSSGIQALVEAYKEAKEAGIELILINPSQNIRDVLQVTRLITIFRIADSVEEALRFPT